MEKQLGPEAKAVFKIEEGKVVLGVQYVGVQAEAGLEIKLSAEAYGQMLKDAIPGEIDNAVIDLLVAAIKNVKI